MWVTISCALRRLPDLQGSVLDSTQSSVGIGQSCHSTHFLDGAAGTGQQGGAHEPTA